MSAGRTCSCCAGAVTGALTTGGIDDRSALGLRSSACSGAADQLGYDPLDAGVALECEFGQASSVLGADAD